MRELSWNPESRMSKAKARAIRDALMDIEQPLPGDAERRGLMIQWLSLRWKL